MSRNGYFGLIMAVLVLITSACGGATTSKASVAGTETKASATLVEMPTNTTVETSSAETTVTTSTTAVVTTSTTIPTTAATTSAPTTSSTTAASTTADATTVAAAQSWGAGLYEAGKDIPAGEYVISGKDVYTAVLKDSTDSYESIISNAFFNNRYYVTVREGEFLQLKSGMAYPAAAAPPVAATGNLPEGMYKVGVDIPPGEYKIAATAADDSGSASSGTYLEILSSSVHAELKNLVAIEIFEDDFTVKVEDGQYLVLHVCELLR